MLKKPKENLKKRWANIGFYRNPKCALIDTISDYSKILFFFCFANENE